MYNHSENFSSSCNDKTRWFSVISWKPCWWKGPPCTGDGIRAFLVNRWISFPRQLDSLAVFTQWDSGIHQNHEADERSADRFMLRQCGFLHTHDGRDSGPHSPCLPVLTRYEKTLQCYRTNATTVPRKIRKDINHITLSVFIKLQTLILGLWSFYSDYVSSGSYSN